MTLIIPNTTQWAKIRNIWGEPEYVISAVGMAGGFALCLPEMHVRIELIDRAGRVIPLQAAGGPYGYSTACAWSSLKFSAAPGNELTLKLTGTRQGTVPAGDLIVNSYWLNTKDKIVGLAIDEEVESLIKWVSIFGVLLVGCGAGILFVNRLRRHAVH